MDLSLFQIYQSNLTGPPMPYKVHESAMISTSDGKGVILSGGYNGYYGSNPLDTIIELRENEVSHELEWIVRNQTMSTPRRSHVMFLVSDKCCKNATILDPIIIHNYCENSIFVEKATLKWIGVGSVIILLIILAPIMIYYYKKSSNDNILRENKLNYELELPVIPNIMISEQNPSYETSDSNLYPQEVLSLPHIDVTQILKGNLIGSIIYLYFFLHFITFLNLIFIHFRIWKFW